MFHLKILYLRSLFRMIDCNKKKQGPQQEKKSVSMGAEGRIKSGAEETDFLSL